MKQSLGLLFSFLFLMVFLAGGYYLIQNFEKLTKTVVKGNKPAETITTTSENHIDEILPEAAVCQTDDECILSPVTPACGCYYVINKHYNPQRLEDAVRSFRTSGKKCGEPQIQCQTAPLQEHLKCISGKCDIVRPTSDPERTFSDDTKKMQEEIKLLIDNANYCATDDNCTIADIDSQCPFGCYNLVSKNADLSLIKEGIAKYRVAQPDSCMYKCMAAPQINDIKCVNNKCIDLRINN